MAGGKYIYTNPKPDNFQKVTVHDLIHKYEVLVEDYKSTMKQYIKGKPEYENLRVQCEIYEMILSDLKRIRI